MGMKSSFGTLGIVSACAIGVAAGSLARADTGAEFYNGKSLDLIVSVQEGSPGTDAAARIVARHMTNTMPGKPTIVVRNMPGAGHLRAANYLYVQAPKDGTTYGLIWPAYVMHQVLGGPNVNYDATNFIYIGSTGLSNSTVFVWHTVDVKTIEDAKKREVLMGGTGVGSDTVRFPKLLNSTLGTKFKVVMGYKGASAIDLALQRGEIEGRAGAAFSTIVGQDWIKNKQVNVLVQIGEKPEPGFEHVPMLTELAQDAQTREMLQVFSSGVALGRPFMAPPGVPANRISVLRAGFEKAVQEPTLVSEFKKMRLDLVPMKGERVSELVKQMVNVSPEVLARLKSVLADEAARAKKKK